MGRSRGRLFPFLSALVEQETTPDEMFTLTEVASLNDIQPTYRILKPWWDVFMDYLGFVMLMLAIFAGTMQITKDQVACLPILEEVNKTSNTNSYMSPSPVEAATSSLGTVPVVTRDLPDSTVHKISVHAEPQPKGRKTNLDYQQYIFVNQICYHVALPWYSKYFPYLVLIHTIVLMVSSNFWFKYPKTSSKIEHFVSILGRCFESPWTTKALSETAYEDSEGNKQRFIADQSGPKHLSSDSQDERADSTQPILGNNSVKFSAEKIIPEGPSMTILDKKDGEQAKALFEKVRTFRAHVEDSDFIYNLYVAQTIIKALKLIFILGYTSTFAADINFSHICEPKIEHLTGKEKVACNNAQDKQELHLFMLSGLPNAVFDLAELEVLKLELIPEVRISAKVSQMTNLKELHLYNCPAKVEQRGFIFLRDHLRCLHVKFTDVSEIPPWVYLLRSLRELYLIGSLNSEHNKMIALESLKDLRHLKVLYLKSNLSKMPTNLTDLSPHLIKLVVHNDGTKLLVLNSLKKMTSLRELELHHCDLERIPDAVFNLTNLHELDMKSNNIRTIEEVFRFQHLKRLTCLKLWHNKIVSIPSTINLVKNLESLYLSYNKLDSLPASLFNLPKLRYLDLGNNTISSIPENVELLQNLQHFDITGNKVEVLPDQLFKCTKLKVLCVGNNSITVLPELIGELTELVQLDVKGNCLAQLPNKLGQCRQLHKSLFIVEDHLLDTLPLEVKESMTEVPTFTV
ncbi:hypothetical protein AMELA_G00105230 [Ameiurus melas]|uniref:Uncharacterized protein n=1 Tax=Ameiurus melas TaxID=219545 RepID=A0A7J6AXR8_AMEME|nr:hypothetical protein AMELA_G00105230 [Ameiurus melas]